MAPHMGTQKGTITFLGPVMENVCSFQCWAFVLHSVLQSIRDMQEPSSQGSYWAPSNAQPFPHILEVPPEMATNPSIYIVFSSKEAMLQ